MSDRMYTTAEVMELLGVKSRQTLYAWRARPAHKEPGQTGRLLWSGGEIMRLAEIHGRQVTL